MNSSDNPLASAYANDAEDLLLVRRAQSGDREALNQLVQQHHTYIYNVAARMVWNPTDAEEVSQEVLVKVVTKLSTFRGESTLRTWMYRIVCNHVLNMRRRGLEHREFTFATAGQALDSVPDAELPDPSSTPVDLPVLVEEAKQACLSGMLMCFDRRQRLAFTLVDVLGASNPIAAELMELTEVNLRQILSRARRDLNQFTNAKCGLVNPSNPCRCQNKTRSFIRSGYVDPQNLRFTKSHVTSVKKTVQTTLNILESSVDEVQRIRLLDSELLEPPGCGGEILRVLEDPAIRLALRLDG